MGEGSVSHREPFGNPSVTFREPFEKGSRIHRQIMGTLSTEISRKPPEGVEWSKNGLRRLLEEWLKSL